MVRLVARALGYVDDGGKAEDKLLEELSDKMRKVKDLYENM